MNKKIEEQRWSRWLKAKEAAEYAGCARGTFLSYFVNTGRVRPAVTGYGNRYDRFEIDRVLEGQQVS